MFRNKQRKRQLWLAGVIGALLMAVPFFISVVFLLLHEPEGGLRQKEEEESKWETAWRLKTALEAGELIEDRSLEEIRIPRQAVAWKQCSREHLLGKAVKLDLSSGIILTEDMLYQGEVFADDIRTHNYGYIKLNHKMKPGDYVDIRISFPNGVDCIVLSKKKVMDISLYNSEENTENILWLEVGEDEILRLSSAAVDAYLWEGSSIYAIKYTAETQKKAIVTYPVNEVVLQLMKEDPNIIAKAEEAVSKRLREQLYQAMEKADKSYGNTVDKGSIDGSDLPKENKDGGELPVVPQRESMDEEITFLD